MISLYTSLYSYRVGQKMRYIWDRNESLRIYINVFIKLMTVLKRLPMNEHMKSSGSQRVERQFLKTLCDFLRTTMHVSSSLRWHSFCLLHLWSRLSINWGEKKAIKFSSFRFGSGSNYSYLTVSSDRGKVYWVLELYNLPLLFQKTNWMIGPMCTVSCCNNVWGKHEHDVRLTRFIANEQSRCPRCAKHIVAAWHH